jgi:hypothetical protein
MNISKRLNEIVVQESIDSNPSEDQYVTNHNMG